ncbi:ESX secretion-associated protein EspG [Nocardia sp. NPDC057353]|uniref:ESX secretion-associated protein EspG n=1 Tax=Nocardia sp. NPDC057353 TaxID=3346104 RepID=UPI0036435A06
MSRQWSFTDLEFVLLCDRADRGSIPEPFTYTSRIALAEDYAVERRRVWAELESRDDPDLRVISDALDRPDVSIAVRAWDEADYSDQTKHIRAHVLRWRSLGLVITQRPGESVWHSAGFDVAECDPHAIADVALAQLPTAKAGRSTDLLLPGPDPQVDADDYSAGPAVGDELEVDDAQRGARFLAAPAALAGDVTVYQGRSKFGPRGRIGMTLEWRDLPDDGRYAIRSTGSARTASGMGTKGMAEWANEQVTEILLRLDRHMENEE